jgi:hypothetical protein
MEDLLRLHNVSCIHVTISSLVHEIAHVVDSMEFLSLRIRDDLQGVRIARCGDIDDQLPIATRISTMSTRPLDGFMTRSSFVRPFWLTWFAPMSTELALLWLIASQMGYESSDSVDRYVEPD